MQTLIHWFSKLSLWQHWDPRSLTASVPPPIWPYQYLYLGLVLAGLFLALVLAFLRLHPDLKRSFGAFLWTNAILGLALYFFRVQRLPYLGTDFWRLIQELGDLVWLGFILRYLFTGYRQTQLQERVRVYKQRFLPGQKIS